MFQHLWDDHFPFSFYFPFLQVGVTVVAAFATQFIYFPLTKLNRDDANQIELFAGLKVEFKTTGTPAETKKASDKLSHHRPEEEETTN